METLLRVSNKILIDNNTSVISESSKRARTNKPFRECEGEPREFALEEPMCRKSVFIEIIRFQQLILSFPIFS